MHFKVISVKDHTDNGQTCLSTGESYHVQAKRHRWHLQTTDSLRLSELSIQ